ncbi:hypothetical protein SRB5_12300 [Streptomyces sp. RB5]|uniref:Uncharacterized protein n=1 Tax=Streptomyces smaragdinus TaxID=2585196 RepID=A0A7K0CCM6_9ACTN|nr:hypothetical protein [Streptomyces smaragdinus]MQY11116.1 hypothetical protein [Streptomyces smaragdinus]
MSWQNNPQPPQNPYQQQPQGQNPFAQQPQNPYGPQQGFPPGQPQPPRRPSRLQPVLVKLIGVVVALGIAGAIAVLRDDDSSSPRSSGSDSSQEWKEGGCGGPDKDKGGTAYRTYDCDDAAATLKALKVMGGSFMPDSIQCPAGTDAIIEVKTTYGSGGGGIPSSTVCGRNLKGDHPGDAGAGGGQLVEGDCIDNTAKEIACATAGDSDFKVMGLVKDKAQCPSGTTEPLELMMAIGRPYSVICGGKP